MSAVGLTIFMNPPPISNQVLKFNIYRKNPLRIPAFHTPKMKESEIFYRNSVRSKNMVAAGSIETGIVGAGEDGERSSSPAGSALEHEVLIDETVGIGGIHTLVNQVSKWIVAVTYSGFLLLRHDAFTWWSLFGAALNMILSVILKRTLKQERPVSRVRSGPGMPSSHAQSIFYTIGFVIWSLLKWQGLNGVTTILGVLVMKIGSYFSWLRVSNHYHTLSQVVVGAVAGFTLSVFWFWAWEEIVHKAYYSSLWVRVIVIAGASCFSLGLVLRYRE